MLYVYMHEARIHKGWKRLTPFSTLSQKASELWAAKDPVWYRKTVKKGKGEDKKRREILNEILRNKTVLKVEKKG